MGLSEVLLLQRDHTAAAQAEEVAQVRRENSGDAHLAADLLARCVPLAEKSDDLPEGQRQELARR